MSFVLHDPDAARQAVLRQKPAPNPPHLTKLVKVRCVKGFYDAKGNAATPGEVCSVSFATAQDLVAIRRAEYVSES